MLRTKIGKPAWAFYTCPSWGAQAPHIPSRLTCEKSGFTSTSKVIVPLSEVGFLSLNLWYTVAVICLRVSMSVLKCQSLSFWDACVMEFMTMTRYPSRRTRYGAVWRDPSHMNTSLDLDLRPGKLDLLFRISARFLWDLPTQLSPSKHWHAHF